MIKEAVGILKEGRNLTAGQMETAMEEIMSGKVSTPDIIPFLINLSKKGETAEELTAAAIVMRRHATKIEISQEVIFDNCGTGGDKSGTFNVSTIAAFVVSGSGILVAKHGNRSVSSHCGSADILESLGVNINMEPDKIKKCLEKVGIVFLFAQNFHPAMKYAMQARKEICSRTIFNLLGPLSNPAGATHQLVGVYDEHWTGVLAEVFAKLGSRHALIAHGSDGLDEVTTTGKTFIAEERLGKISKFEIIPEKFGLKKAELKDLSGGTAFDNSEIFLDILQGKPGFQRDIVVLNAACALYAADKAGSIEEGIEYAEISIDSKEAFDKFIFLREFSNQ